MGRGASALLRALPFCSVRRGVEVIGELPDSAEIGLPGALAEAGELKVLEHPQAECR